MKKVFPVPPPIVVPDGTKLSEIIGSRVLSELGERVSDGVSVALGTLPPEIVSKVHVHPVIWHFTWVLSGELTVKMKDSLSDEPYELTVPKDNGVLTEQGTFFQLINRGEKECRVLYIVGPGFVFEQDGSEVKYNDAVVFEEDWAELKQLSWQPPSLPSFRDQFHKRDESLHRLAGTKPLEEVHGERWRLTNSHGGLDVHSRLHNILTAPFGGVSTELSEPDRIGEPSDGIHNMVNQYYKFLIDIVGLEMDKGFNEARIKNIVKRKCAESPSYLAEYELALIYFELTLEFVHPEDVWHLLLFGTHDGLTDDSILSRIRRFILEELLDLAVTVGGGFKSAGAMENYRAYRGGIYTDPKSYRHYINS